MQSELLGENFSGARLNNFRFEDKYAERIHKWISGKKDMLVFSGCVGIGKTHFSSAMFAWFYGKVPSIRMYKEKHFFEKLYKDMDNKKSVTSIHERLDDEYLIYDDLGVEKTESEWVKSMIHEIVDYRHSARKPTIITTNFRPDQILQVYGARIYDRIMDERNCIIEIHDKPSIRANRHLIE